jgi:LL-H family phage holin|nr:MAG TPA: holin [Caudoviricetes sp.]
MDEIIFEVIKLVVMVAALVVARYLVPWIKDKIGADKLAQIEKWTKYAVEMAQQVHWTETGEDKKAIVTEFLRGILTAKNIALSDEQLDVLIEAAVKEMKIAENAGISIEAVETGIEVPESGQ